MTIEQTLWDQNVLKCYWCYKLVTIKSDNFDLQKNVYSVQTLYTIMNLKTLNIDMQKLVHQY